MSTKLLKVYLDCILFFFGNAAGIPPGDVEFIYMSHENLTSIPHGLTTLLRSGNCMDVCVVSCMTFISLHIKLRKTDNKNKKNDVESIYGNTSEL